jgi:hypothetical protein
VRNLVTLPNFNGVAVSQTATVQLPVGNVTYHKIVLAYGTTLAGNGNQANTEANVTQIRLKVNGKIQRVFSAKQLNAINAFYGRSFQSRPIGGVNFGFLEIFLSEPWRRTPAGEDMLAWGTQDISTFQIEVDLGAAGTAPQLIPHADVEYLSRPLGLISKWRSYTQPVSAAGIVTNNTLPKNGNEAYQAIHAFPVLTTDIIDTTVKTDQVVRFQGTDSDMRSLLASESPGGITSFAPQASMTHIVFDRTGRVSDALPMQYVDATGKPTGNLVGDFRVDFNMNAGNSFPFIAHVLGPRD